MRAFMAGQTVNIRNPRAIRPWQHVLEPLSGYLELAEQLWDHGDEFAEGWNFGPYDEDAKAVSWIVEQLTDRWGGTAAWRLDEAEHPHEAHYLKLDTSKARARLNWQPRWRLEEALGRIVDWYRAYVADEDMQAFSLGQIKAYQSSEPI